MAPLLVGIALGAAFIAGALGVFLGWLARYGPVEPLPVTPPERRQAGDGARHLALRHLRRPVTAEVKAECQFACGRVFHQGCYTAKGALAAGGSCAVCVCAAGREVQGSAAQQGVPDPRLVGGRGDARPRHQGHVRPRIFAEALQEGTSASSPSKSQPVTPCSITSGRPPRRRPTTGRVQAMAFQHHVRDAVVQGRLQHHVGGVGGAQRGVVGGVGVGRRPRAPARGRRRDPAS
ncbi:MAG: hypothetical protein R3F59_33080 [Myxococcota bacterium]